MTDHRSRNADGHAVGDGKDRTRTSLNEQPTGAFDLLSAQIEALRQDMEYLREQVAHLQETVLRQRARER
jgi:outer membrane murein-binding lipoprotein Lpp